MGFGILLEVDIQPLARSRLINLNDIATAYVVACDVLWVFPIVWFNLDPNLSQSPTRALSHELNLPRYQFAMSFFSRDFRDFRDFSVAWKFESFFKKTFQLSGNWKVASSFFVVFIMKTTIKSTTFNLRIEKKKKVFPSTDFYFQKVDFWKKCDGATTRRKRLFEFKEHP